MIGRLIAILAGACVLFGQAHAQPLFGNPFADAAAYRSERGEPGEARYRLRYEVTTVERGGEPMVSELVIDVAADWSVTRAGDVVVLRDFRLNRVFTLGAGHFTTMNGLGELTFRVTERQNRAYVQHVLDAATNRGELADACDAESELGTVIPGAAGAGTTEFRERRGVVTLRCNGRDIGSLTPSDSPAPPPAFWPTMYSAMTTHPAPASARARNRPRPREVADILSTGRQAYEPDVAADCSRSCFSTLSARPNITEHDGGFARPNRARRRPNRR